MSETRLLHINPYIEELNEKCKELNQPNKDNIKTINDIALVMDYVDRAQMEALMGDKDSRDKDKPDPPDSVSADKKLEDLWDDVQEGMKELRDDLKNEDGEDEDG